MSLWFVEILSTFGYIFNMRVLAFLTLSPCTFCLFSSYPLHFYCQSQCIPHLIYSCSSCLCWSHNSWVGNRVSWAWIKAGAVLTWVQVFESHGRQAIAEKPSTHRIRWMNERKLWSEWNTSLLLTIYCLEYTILCIKIVCEAILMQIYPLLWLLLLLMLLYINYIVLYYIIYFIITLTYIYIHIYIYMCVYYC